MKIGTVIDVLIIKKRIRNKKKERTEEYLEEEEGKKKRIEKEVIFREKQEAKILPRIKERKNKIKNSNYITIITRNLLRR